jgi:hypothetical protein
MNFKDKAYYTNKAKDCLGLVMTALMFDTFIALMFVLA